MKTILLVNQLISIMEENCLHDTDNGYINPKYPSGYMDRLDDGIRLGSRGDVITKSHDRYALGKIIFNMYDLVHPDINAYDSIVNPQPQTEEQKRLNDLIAHLQNLREAFYTVLKGDYEALPLGPCKLLEDYLNLAQANKFKFQMTEDFKKSLTKCNLYQNQGSRIHSEGATGSPKK